MIDGMKQAELGGRKGAVLLEKLSIAEMSTCSKSAIIKATSNALSSISSNLLSLAKQTLTEILDEDLKHKLQKGMN